VIEHHHHTLGVEDLLRPVPRALYRHRQIEVDDDVRAAHGDIAGPHHVLARRARQNFLYGGQAHVHSDLTPAATTVRTMLSV
jgi:hypothetical protein